MASFWFVLRRKRERERVMRDAADHLYFLGHSSNQRERKKGFLERKENNEMPLTCSLHEAVMTRTKKGSREDGTEISLNIKYFPAFFFQKSYEFGYDVKEYDEYGNPNVHSRHEQRDGYKVQGKKKRSRDPDWIFGILRASKSPNSGILRRAKKSIRGFRGKATT